MELRDKTIILTGGTSGVGLELAKLLSLNNEVIVLARHIDKLHDSSISARPIQAYSCDLSEQKSVDEVANKILKRHPSLDILINNAAIQMTPKFTDKDFALESIDREILVNFGAICRLTHHLLPSLLKDSRSVILNVNSGLALAPKTTSAVYCATKAALNSFSISLGYQLEQTNIRVLQAFLPLVDTAMTRGRGEGKISAPQAAQSIVKCLEGETSTMDVGKVRFLRILLRLSPKLAHKIMKRG